MILVTGASGKTGQAVTRAFVRRGVHVRALVRREEQSLKLKELGASEIVVGDIRNDMVWDHACVGVEALYHICPNMEADEAVIGYKMIRAAQTANVKRVVYHSVLHPQVEAMPHHWLKMRVEEALFASGLAYTILQPAAYMQNVLGYWKQITELGIYPLPYNGEVKISMVDLEEVADVAALVLLEEKHVGAIYELAGEEILSQYQVTEILSQVLGRVIRFERVAWDVWEKQARDSGMGEYQRETLLKMFMYYDKNGFWGSASVLSWLLGRTPRSFGEVVRGWLS